MNRVMPVVVVIGVNSVPAAVVRFKRVMRPANAGIGTCNHNSLAGESKLPNLRRVRVTDSWFNRLRYPQPQRRFNSRKRLRGVNLHVLISFYSRHVGAGSQCLSDLATAFYQNCVNDVEGAMLQPVFTQPMQNRALRCVTLMPQGIINVAVLFSLCPHRSSRAYVGLISKYN